MVHLQLHPVCNGSRKVRHKFDFAWATLDQAKRGSTTGAAQLRWRENSTVTGQRNCRMKMTTYRRPHPVCQVVKVYSINYMYLSFRKIP